jgi:hypothetical protein
MSTAEYYATSSRQSTDAMQDMTEHMHHKTVSMHVITIFTLIFLPGTFVAVSRSLVAALCVDLANMVRCRLFSAAAYSRSVTRATWALARRWATGRSESLG